MGFHKILTWEFNQNIFLNYEPEIRFRVQSYPTPNVDTGVERQSASAPLHQPCISYADATCSIAVRTPMWSLLCANQGQSAQGLLHVEAWQGLVGGGNWAGMWVGLESCHTAMS